MDASEVALGSASNATGSATGVVLSPRRLAWAAIEGPAVFALVAVFVLHAALLFLTHHTYFAFPDNTTQFWAWYQKQAADWHSALLPLWDQNTLSGHSFVGEAQQGAFYPINIVWLLLLGTSQGIGPRRLDLLVELHFFIASTGLYALVRSFGVGRLAAIVAAIVFAYTGPVFERSTGQTAIFFGLAWTPWAVFFACRAMAGRHLLWAMAAGVPIGLGVLAGHFQPPFNAALLVILVYALTVWPADHRLRELGIRVVAAATTLVVAAIVALPQLSYSLPYLSRADRWVGTANPVPPGGKISFDTFSTLYSGGPDSVLSLFDPQRYPVPDGGSLYMTLAAIAVLLVAAAARPRVVWQHLGGSRFAVIGALLVGFLAMIGRWTFFARVLYALPFVSEVRELARYSIMVELALAVILAVSLETVRREWFAADQRASRGRRALAVVGGLSALDGVYLIVYVPPASTSWFGLQLLLGALAVVVLAVASDVPVSRWVSSRRRLLSRLPAASVKLATLALVIGAAAFHSDLRTLGSTSSAMYPPTYYAGTSELTYIRSTCAGHRTLALGTALPVNVGDVFRSIRTTSGYGATMQANYFAFISSSASTSRVQTTLLDERCIVSSAAISVPHYKLGFQDESDGVRVYVDDHTSPLNTPGLNPISTKQVEFSDRNLEYSVDLRRPERAIISAVTYPGWTARVDGKQVPVNEYRAGGRGVFPIIAIPAGHHVVSYSWDGWPS